MAEFTGTKVVQLTLFGTVIGQQTVNRFFYGSVDLLADLEGAMAAFNTQVVPALQLIMSNVSGFTRLEGQWVRGGDTFAAIDLDAVGLNSGDCCPPYVAFDFTLLRGGVGERNGYKRIAGVPESEQSNGTITGGSVGAVNLAAEAMGATLTPGVFTWQPVIKRTRVNRIPVTPARYYLTSACLYSKIGTQNSRKFGHGR